MKIVFEDREWGIDPNWLTVTKAFRLEDGRNLVFHFPQNELVGMSPQTAKALVDARFELEKQKYEVQ